MREKKLKNSLTCEAELSVVGDYHAV